MNVEAQSSPPRRVTREERRRTILRAGAEALFTDGPAAVSMEGVAARIGVSKPVVYDHFPNRSALLVAIYDEYADFLADRLGDAVVDAGSDLETVVRATARRYFDAVAERGFIVRVLIEQSKGDPHVEASRERLRGRVVDLLAARLRMATDLDMAIARRAIALVGGMAETAVGMWLSGRVEREEIEPLYVRMVVATMRDLERGESR